MKVIVRGQQYVVSQDEAIERILSEDPKPIAIHAVTVEGRVYPVKQAAALALGVDLLDLQTMQARDIMLKLGFTVFRVS